MADAREPVSEESQRTSGYWTRAVKAYHRVVVVRLLASGCPLERAQEIAQETWTRLIEQDRLGRLREVSLPGLAIRQAIFLWKDALRRENRASVIPEDPGGLPAPECQEQRVIARAALRQAEQVLESLSPTAQTVFRLAYGPERPPAAQIAERVGLSTQRVRQILCEIRRHLAGIME